MLTVLFYHVSTSYFGCWLILFNSCSFEQIFNPFAEFTISIEIPSKAAKAKMEIQPAATQAKISKCSI